MHAGLPPVGAEGVAVGEVQVQRVLVVVLAVVHVPLFLRELDDLIEGTKYNQCEMPSSCKSQNVASKFIYGGFLSKYFSDMTPRNIIPIKNNNLVL